MQHLFGVDIGGTFTDIVLASSDGAVRTCKVASTTSDYGEGIVAGLAELIAAAGIDPAAVSGVVHGTTVATNTILEGRGARTGLITTKGFRDVLEMRRLRIPQMYNLQYTPPRPLAPRRLRLEVDERTGPRGQIWSELDEASVERAADRLAAAGVEAVAVSLINSYANPNHERRIGEIVARRMPKGTHITLSSDLLPEIREYERTSTTVVNAYIGPMVEHYLAALTGRLHAMRLNAPLRIMQSNGGVMAAQAAIEKPAYIIESGPAAGVIAAVAMARHIGIANVISLDMGGTTAKAALIENGEPAKTTEYEVGAGINLSSKLVKGGGYAVKLPFIDISEIGAGGGSIVSVDSVGSLKVGPRSAGAEPGPACYGLGGAEPTFTDAMVVLGYINPKTLAGGRVRLHAELAHRVITEPCGGAAERIAGGSGVGRLRRCRRQHDAGGEGGFHVSRPRSPRLRADGVRRQRAGGGGGNRARVADDPRHRAAGARRVQRVRPVVLGHRVRRQPHHLPPHGRTRPPSISEPNFWRSKRRSAKASPETASPRANDAAAFCRVALLRPGLRARGSRGRRATRSRGHGGGVRCRACAHLWPCLARRADRPGQPEGDRPRARRHGCRAARQAGARGRAAERHAHRLFRRPPRAIAKPR